MILKIKFLKANNGDSILISFIDDKETARNILIDTGTSKTYYDEDNSTYGDLFDITEELNSKSEKIDLLIITHIDDDHIGGLLKWFSMNKSAYNLIENIWFNSGKAISQYLKEEENRELKVLVEDISSSYSSVRQSKDFEKYIDEHNITKENIIQFLIEPITLFDLSIQVLSPDKQSLEKLLKEYQRPKNNYFTSGSKDWNILIENFIREENEGTYLKTNKEKDNSTSNRSSIAFILSYKDSKMLFLGDAHLEVVLNSLKILGYSEKKPLEVDFVKLSHHGSKNNTNIEFLKLVKTNRYVISTDSSKHNHPDKRTLSRIIYVNPNAEFYFNYEYVKDNIFKKDDFEKFKDYKIKMVSEL